MRKAATWRPLYFRLCPRPLRQNTRSDQEDPGSGSRVPGLVGRISRSRGGEQWPHPAETSSDCDCQAQPGL